MNKQAAMPSKTLHWPWRSDQVTRTRSSLSVWLGIFGVAAVCSVAQSTMAAAPAIRPAGVAHTDQNTITIGAVISQTGVKAALAIHQQRGYDLAVKRINERGGLDINGRRYLMDILYRDDQSKRRIAKQAAQELIDQDIDFLLGGFSSGLVNAVATVTEPHRIPLVQGGGALLSLYEHDRRYLFGVVSTIEKYLTSILSLAIDRAGELGRRPDELKLAIAVVDGQAGRESRQPVIEAASRLGIDVVVDQLLTDPLDQAQFSRLFDEVEHERPDILLVFGYDIGARMSVEELANRQIDLPVFGTTHCDGAEIEKLGMAAEYTLCTSQWDAYANYADDWFGSSVNFLVEFELEYGYLPPYQAAQGAATVFALADGLQRAGSLDTEMVRAALSETDLGTMFGPIMFDQSGKNVAKPMVVLQIQNSRYKVVWPKDVAWTRAVIPAPVWRDR